MENSMRDVKVVEGEPYIKAVSIPEAYAKALRLLGNVKSNSIDHLVIAVEKPLLPTPPLTENSDIVSNYERFLNFESSKDPSGKTLRAFHEEYKKLKLGDKSGEGWIQDRIKVLCPSVKELMEEVRRIFKIREELLDIKQRYRNLTYREEHYVQRLTSFGDYRGMLYEYWREGINQLAVLIYKLAKEVPQRGNKSFVYGSLSIYDPNKDCLNLVCDRRVESIRQYPCLTAIDVKLTENSMNLCALWRHQYFDIKAYGNLISLAMLLKEICDVVNYFRREFGFKEEVKYGKITSIACRADFSKDKKVEETISERF